MVNIILNRTFWPVGHGAFYTEEHIFRSSDKAFCAVYDCGGKSKQIIEQQIDEFLASKGSPKIDYLFISHFHRDHINGVRYLLANVKVEHIVIPQLENTRLIEAYIYNAITGDNINYTQDDAHIFIRLQLATHDIPVERIIEVEPANDDYSNPEPPINEHNTLVLRRRNIRRRNIEIKDNNGLPYWIYIPVNIDYDKEKRRKLIDELNAICAANGIPHVVVDEKIQWNSIDALLKTNMKYVKQIYKDIFKENHNAYSMPVYSGPVEYAVRCHDVDFRYNYMDWYPRHPKYWCTNRKLYKHVLKRMMSCLYMGDFEAKDSNNLNKLRTALKPYYYRIGMQQVPHHYSPNNHNTELYNDRIIAFGNIDYHKDVSFCYSVYDQIQRETCLPPIVITEENDYHEFMIKFRIIN